MNLQEYTPSKEDIQETVERTVRSELIGPKLDRIEDFYFLTKYSGHADFSKPPNASKLRYKDAIPITEPNNGTDSLQKLNEQIEEEKKKEQEQKMEPNNCSRKRIIKQTNAFPESAHGIVIIKKSENDTPRWGSGVLVGPDTVLTAAHIVYDDEKPIRKRYPYIRFIPGANEDEAPFGEIEVEDVYVHKDYLNNDKAEDVNGKNWLEGETFALLHLQKPIGLQTGYLGICFVTSLYQKPLKEISIMGYGRRELQSTNQGSFEQWREERAVIGMNKEKGLIHYEGNSSTRIQPGSSIIYKDRTNWCYVVGVHIGRNSACWIPHEQFQDILSWKSEAIKKKFEEILRGQEDESSIRSLELDFGKKNIGNLGANVLSGYGLKGLEKLDLRSCGIDENGLEDLIKSNWPNLWWLNLSENKIGNKGCEALARNTTWKSLKNLFLRSNKINYFGINALIQNKSWSELEVLDLTSNEVGEQGVISIAASENWKNLRCLDLAKNKIGDEGGSAIASNTSWCKLEGLILNNNQISGQGIRQIALNTSWCNLNFLDLSYNRLGDEGAIAIGENTSWNNLDELRLSHNEIGDKGAIGLGSNTVWTKLKALEMIGNLVGEEGGVAIGGNMTWKKLQTLDLGSNRLGNKSAVAMAKNPTWESLQEIYLEKNKITDEGAIALGRNNSWKKLWGLHLSQNDFGWKGAIALVRNSSWISMSMVEISNKRLSEERRNALIANAPLNYYIC